MIQLIHLIYNSVAVSETPLQELREILQVARNKNAALGVTGMLLYADGTFFQVLEGPEDVVDTLAARIQQDKRHDRMTVIIREPIAHRSFGEWTMGFAHLTAADLRSLEGANDLFQSGRVLESMDSGRAKKLLQAFKQGRWRMRFNPSTQRQTDVTVPPEPAPDADTGSHPGHTSVRPPFTFAYQPIVDAEARKVSGYEALVRGPGGEPSAAVLNRVPLEDIGDFDDDARRVAIAQACRLGLRSRLHVNVMPHARISTPRTLDSTLETAHRCGLSPDRLVLEIKHEATILDPRSIGRWLQEYRARGVQISIDDFGSGHAGLALLDHYQPELISLSMWLVRGIESHGPRQAILRGLMQTCNDLGIDVVAKGVETDDEYNWLRSEGVNLYQGLLLCKPGFEALPRPMLPADVD